MAKLYNLARMTTATTGTGTITLGSAVSGYLTFAQAGVANADVVDYAIKDGSNSEIGTGTYTSSGTTLTRTVTKSTNSNSAISLSGSAEVFISPRAETLNDASVITTGTVTPARLGSGVVGSGTKFLADNSTFQTLTNSGLVQFNFYTSTQTITIPTGATRAKVTLWGGAGGGQNSDGSTYNGGNGSGGGALIKWLTSLTAGNTLAYTQGAGGAANGNGGASSLASGTQSITTLTANGGVIGTNNGSTRVSGGTATNGDLNYPGSSSIGAGNTAGIASTGLGRGFAGYGGVVAVPTAGTGSAGGCEIEWYY